jgi:SulP family sulfate permease
LPEATLAAVIMMAVAGLVNVRAIKNFWKTDRSDGLVAIATFLFTLAFAPHLDWSILLGTSLALGIFVYRTMTPSVLVLGRHADGTLRDAETFGLARCQHILPLRLDARLYFGNTAHFVEAVRKHLSQQPSLKVVVIMAQAVNSLDVSGEVGLSRLIEHLESAGLHVLFCGVKWRVMAVLERSGFLTRHGKARFVRTEREAFVLAWNLIGCDHREQCPLNSDRTHPAPEKQQPDPLEPGQRKLGRLL